MALGSCHLIRQAAAPAAETRGEVCRAVQHLLLIFTYLQLLAYLGREARERWVDLCRRTSTRARRWWRQSSDRRGDRRSVARCRRRDRSVTGVDAESTTSTPPDRCRRTSRDPCVRSTTAPPCASCSPLYDQLTAATSSSTCWTWHTPATRSHTPCHTAVKSTPNNY